MPEDASSVNAGVDCLPALGFAQLRQADGRSVLAGAAGRATPRPGQRTEERRMRSHDQRISEYQQSSGVSHGINHMTCISRKYAAFKPEAKVALWAMLWHARESTAVAGCSCSHSCNPGRNLISVHLGRHLWGPLICIPGRNRWHSVPGKLELRVETVLVCL